MAKQITMRVHHRNGETYGFEKWDYIGHRIIKTDDPEGQDIPSEWGNAAFLDPAVPKIPPTIWSAIIDLYIYFLENEETSVFLKNQKKPDTGLEVAVFFTLNSKTNEIECWVPSQAISGASVHIDYTQPVVNLITGERIENGINGMPDHVLKRGTSHSHNFMGAFFSGVDDENELKQPGIHIVVGSFDKRKNEKQEEYWSYQIASSAVIGKTRYRDVLYQEDGTMKCRKMDWTDLIEYDADVKTQFHRGCLSVIALDLKSLKNGEQSTLVLMERDDDDVMARYYGGGGYYGNYAGTERKPREMKPCSVPGCNGDVSEYSGYCWKCEEYHPDWDGRDEATKSQDAKAEPIYDGRGDLCGFRVPSRGGNQWIHKYGKAGYEFARMQKRHKWPEKDKAYKGSSGKFQKRDKAEMSLSHHALDEKQAKGRAVGALRTVGIDPTSTGGKVLAYELSQLDMILHFFKELPEEIAADVQQAMRDIGHDWDVEIVPALEYDDLVADAEVID